MDPNVQVAIATVIGTTITTLGVVFVALINSRRGDKDDDDPDDAGQDPNNVMGLLQSLILENARKEKTIEALKRENTKLRDENSQLKGTA